MNNQNENRISLLLPNNPADSKRKRLTSARPKGFVYREEKVKVDKDVKERVKDNEIENSDGDQEDEDEPDPSPIDQMMGRRKRRPVSSPVSSPAPIKRVKKKSKTL